MADIDWSQVEVEVNLFYALRGNKPVGVGKHFSMLFLHEEFRQLTNKEVSSRTIWEHLDEYWDLEALDKSEISPFPTARTTDFELPEDEFGDLLSSKRRNAPSGDDTKPSARRASVDSEANSDPEEDDEESSQRPAATGGKTGKGDWIPAKASPVPTNQQGKMKRSLPADKAQQAASPTAVPPKTPSSSSDSGATQERKNLRDSSCRREQPSDTPERKDRRSTTAKEKPKVDESRRDSRRGSDVKKSEDLKSRRTPDQRGATEKRTRTLSSLVSEEKTDSAKKKSAETRKSGGDSLSNLLKRETPHRGGRSSRNVSPTSSTGSRRNASPVASSYRRNSSPSTSAKRTASPASAKTATTPASASAGNQLRKRSMRSDTAVQPSSTKRSRR